MLKQKQPVQDEFIQKRENVLLEHLGDYLEEPFTILGSYFEGQYLERLVRHQVESYNHFVNYQMQRTIEMFNPIVIKSENDFLPETGEYGLIVNLNITNLRFQSPQIYENNGATKLMMPQEARLRNFTYASSTSVDLHITYHIRDLENNVRTVERTIPKVKLCNYRVYRY